VGLGSRYGTIPRVTRAAVFDLDGVLVDSEVLWNEAKEHLTREAGGRWSERAPVDMMGMSSLEWSRYMREELAVPLSPEEINSAVVASMEGLYRERLPLMPGARDAVKRLSRWPLAVASSSNRPIIDLVLELAGVATYFQVTVSSEEVERGKPAPDVYLEAVRRLGVDPPSCVAIEDSHNGILSARAAGMRVVAIPNRAYPPGADALESASVVLDSLIELDPSAAGLE
jgi:HAD superfamily hydrolase (TIGR01509 family)